MILLQSIILLFALIASIWSAQSYITMVVTTSVYKKPFPQWRVNTSLILDCVCGLGWAMFYYLSHLTH